MPPWTLRPCLVRETIVGARDVAHRSAQMETDWTGPCHPGSRSPRRGHKRSQRFRNELAWKGRGGRPLRLRHSRREEGGCGRYKDYGEGMRVL